MMTLLRVKLQYRRIKKIIRSAKIKGYTSVNVYDVFPINLEKFRKNGYMITRASFILKAYHTISWE